ncbi:hypothetical protein [Agrobacterium rosae]|uniref:hypothetical protein n=1 Tax=Agrobacterium rosae TaxID=1972867 RepID=UPI003BA1B4FB
MTTEKHIVHCRAGGKVIIDGDRVEIYLNGPIVVHRKQWCKYLTPLEEAERSFRYDAETTSKLMLEEAYEAVPMKVHKDPTDD